MNEEMVEAIEEGKIVRVSRDYAIREGLLILKRQDLPKALNQEDHSNPSMRIRSERKYVDLDRYRKPLRINDQVSASMIDNFGWIIISKRKERNMSRRQLAEALGVDEEDLKIMELGRLAKNDYVLVNKVESFLGIMLRKENSSYKTQLESKPHRDSRFLKEQKERKIIEEKAENTSMIGNDIEIIDEVD